MQVSYGKLTVNDGLPREDGDGCLAPQARLHTIGRCCVALHGRKLRISAAGKKFFTLWPAYKSLPQLFGQDFVVNFVTYTRVYTVLFKHISGSGWGWLSVSSLVCRWLVAYTGPHGLHTVSHTHLSLISWFKERATCIIGIYETLFCNPFTNCQTYCKLLHSCGNSMHCGTNDRPLFVIFAL